MNVKRFFGRNSREAMQKVRQAFGDSAVVLSTKPSSEGVEIVAMPAESIEALDRFDESSTAAPTAPPAAVSAPVAGSGGQTGGYANLSHGASSSAAAAPVLNTQAEPATPELLATPVQEDIGTLAMSTLSFQDYVRERMLKKRKAELSARDTVVPAGRDAGDLGVHKPDNSVRPTLNTPAPSAASSSARTSAAAPVNSTYDWLSPQDARDESVEMLTMGRTGGLASQNPMGSAAGTAGAAARHHSPASRENVGVDTTTDLRSAEGALDDFEDDMMPALNARSVSRNTAPLPPAPEMELTTQVDMLTEIRAMKAMIEERFGTLAFMDRLQKSPRQAQLCTRLLESGFSPALVRELIESLPAEIEDEMAWVGDILQRNLMTGEGEPDLEDQGGVYALVGSTGVGKTSVIAKLATAFATRHGPSNLGLITLDAYRQGVGASEQLRGHARMLGAPVHTAQDRTALEDLLELLAGKKMVLIDTAGLSQRDARARDLLDVLSHRSIKRVLVLNTAQQGETMDEVLTAYKATQAKGVILSKLDEAAKLGPAIDTLLRHRLKVLAVSTGQRVPEDWHHMTAQMLVQRALRGNVSQAWRLNASEVNMTFAKPMASSAANPAVAGARRQSPVLRDLGA